MEKKHWLITEDRRIKQTLHFKTEDEVKSILHQMDINRNAVKPKGSPRVNTEIRAIEIKLTENFISVGGKDE